MLRILGKILFVTVPAVLAALLVLELGVLELFVPVDDVPVEQWDDPTRLIKYRPNQRGITYPDGDRRHPVPFTINDDGWNSVHGRYEERRRGKKRIALIGDSYVAAFQVRPEESVSGRLETLLGPARAEVYAFGMNGAPLSHYLHVVRHVVARYSPDALVLLLVHNDFDESFRHVQGRYTRSFLRLDLTPDRIAEIPPKPYGGSPILDWIRVRSATFRFFFYRLRIGTRQIRDLYFGLGGRPQPRYEANVDVRAIQSQDDRTRRATEYVFYRLAEIERSSGARVVLVMDTPRGALYEGRDPSESDAWQLNRMSAALAADNGLDMLDLTDSFRRDWEENRQRLEFPRDGHWNARAHGLAARALCERLEESGGVTGSGCAEPARAEAR